MAIKNILKKRIFLATSLFASLLLPLVAYAENFTYKVLEGVPGFPDTSLSNLPSLLLALYRFGIWAVGIAALFMIVIGGIMYAGSAGNTSTASSAKGIIIDALIGLATALVAYLFLYVINPDLTKMNFAFLG